MGGSKMEENARLKEELAAANKAKADAETAATNKDAELKKLKEEADAANKRLADIENKRKEADWAAVKNRLPPGLTATPELEKSVREKYEAGGAAWSNMLLDLKLKNPSKEEGLQHQGEGGRANTTVGVFNAKTQAWEAGKVEGGGNA
jgi:chromosome segregation ATPase